VNHPPNKKAAGLGSDDGGNLTCGLYRVQYENQKPTYLRQRANVVLDVLSIRHSKSILNNTLIRDLKARGLSGHDIFSALDDLERARVIRRWQAGDLVFIQRMNGGAA